jgi:hypothetical protein
MKLLLALAIVAMPVAARAAPPDEGTEDYKVLHPYAEWLTKQRAPISHYGCCSIADGRLVSVRMIGDRIEVRILHPESLPTAPSGWVPVPEEAIIIGKNPSGLPVAWFVGADVRCFIAGDLE